MKKAEEDARSRATDWELAFNREKDTREQLEGQIQVLKMQLVHEMELRISADTDLVCCMQSIHHLNEQLELKKQELKTLTDVAEPVANMFEPRRPGVEVRPLVERLKDTPDKLKVYLQRLRKSIPQQVLGFVKSFYPKANLDVVADGVAGDCSDEKLKILMEEVEPIADRVGQHISLK